MAVRNDFCTHLEYTSNSKDGYFEHITVTLMVIGVTGLLKYAFLGLSVLDLGPMYATDR